MYEYAVIAWDIWEEVACASVTVDDQAGGFVSFEKKYSERFEGCVDSLFEVCDGIFGCNAFACFLHAMREDLLAFVFIGIVGIDMDGRVNLARIGRCILPVFVLPGDGLARAAV